MIDNEKLKDEELEQVNAGVIVETSEGYWALCEDDSGRLMYLGHPGDADMIVDAWKYDLSSDIISEAEYERRYGHPLPRYS
ncbi:MAG: hypothetical protein E7298_12380 [Lachnospiraceae bacterium]|nr:hypothetical protein [Lachnospiraceae bacterium]